MAEVASAYVSILPSAKGFGSKLNSQVAGDIDSSGKKMGSRFGSAMKTGLLAGAAAITGALASTVGSASAAQQAVGGVEAVFGKYADTVLSDSKKAAQGLGLSSTAYNELITVSGAMLKNKGLKDFAEQSTNLVGIGADLSAMFGGSTTQAVEALNAAMRGESDPIERYGISLNETAVNAVLAANGQDKLTGAALDQAKTLARLSLIQKQSADAQGAFGRESNTLAGQQARLGAQFENIKVKIGTGLLPVLTKVASFVNSTALPAFSSVGKELDKASGFVERHKVALTSLAVVVSAVVLVTKLHSAAMAVQAAGGLAALIKSTAVVTKLTKAYAAMQWVLNAALSANPIGLVVIGLVALAAGLVIAYKKSETFRKIVKSSLEAVGKGFDALGKIGTWLWNKALQPAFKFIVGGIASILDMWSSMLATLGNVPGFGWAKDAAEAMGNAADNARAVADGIKKIPPRKTVKITVVYAYQGQRNPGKEDQLDFNPRMGAPGVPPRKAFLAFIQSQYGDSGKRLMDVISKGIKVATPKTVEAAESAFDKLSGALEGTRDKLKDTLDGLKDDFAALAESVSSAFTGDLFGISATEAVAATKDTAAVIGRSVGQNFIDNLTAKKGELSNLLSSFKTLQGWGIDPSFLSQLFASGNGALITELAGMGQTGAMSAASLFGEVNSLGATLGANVANNDPVAKAIADGTTELREVNRQLSFLAQDIGKQLNGAAAQAQRDKKNRGKK